MLCNPYLCYCNEALRRGVQWENLGRSGLASEMDTDRRELQVTTHLDADTILSLILALRGYDGALLVVTHDRFFMRSVAEGENPYSLANLPGAEDIGDKGESEDSDDEARSKPGAIYGMFKGQLRLLEGGMRQYEEIATRAAAKLTKSRPS